MIRAISVDFWGTLVLDGPGADENYSETRLKAIRNILDAAGVVVDTAALADAYRETMTRLTQIWRAGHDLSVLGHVMELLDAVDPELPTKLPLSVLAALVDAYATPALVVPPVFDDEAGPTLQELAASGYRLCLISNIMRSPGLVLRRLLDQQGLLKLFTVLAFSDEWGVRKPAPEIFRRTLRELGARADEVVHVGDHPLLDIRAAKSVGMLTVQICDARAGYWAMRPDAVINRFGELPAALARISSDRAFSSDRDGRQTPVSPIGLEREK